MSVKKPHILLASSNSVAMLENIKHVIGAAATQSIQREIDKNVRDLFKLGEEHYRFSKSVDSRFWRQKISRLYYGAYNVRRAIQFQFKGEYNTDVSDHKNVEKLPEGFPNRDKHKANLRSLRDDRNLADYDHSATESDLITPLGDSERFVEQFIQDAHSFLKGRGFQI